MTEKSHGKSGNSFKKDRSVANGNVIVTFVNTTQSYRGRKQGRSIKQGSEAPEMDAKKLI